MTEEFHITLTYFVIFHVKKDLLKDQSLDILNFRQNYCVALDKLFPDLCLSEYCLPVLQLVIFVELFSVRGIKVCINEGVTSLIHFFFLILEILHF